MIVGLLMGANNGYINLNYSYVNPYLCYIKIFNIMARILAYGRPVKNPINKVTKYHLQAQLYSMIDRAAIIEAAQRNSQIPKAYLSMTFDALIVEVKNFVMNGHSIKLNNFGVISSSVRSDGQNEPGLLKADVDVKQVKFHFRADPVLKRLINRTEVRVVDPPVAEENEEP